MLFPEKFLETNGKPGQHRGLAWVFYMVRLICMAEAADAAALTVSHWFAVVF